MDSFLDSLKNMGAARLAVMALTLFGLVVFFIFIMARSGTPSMTLLYSGLSTADSTEIAAKLDNTRVSYRLSDDGTQISVPHKDVGRARMLLAQEGLPRQGSMGYELFDQKQTFGETSFRQNINQLRALEGELSRTVGTLSQIRSARVHLVLPQRELFSRDTRPASASVFVNLRGNDSLGNEQIQAIQHLVAAAVPQLKSSHVAIIDQSGNLLARGEDDDSGSANARSSEDMRQKYEQRVTRTIEDMVGRIVGFGRVRANVTADLNFDVVSRNSETYNPDGQVVRSTQTVTDEAQDSTSAANAPVSVETNLPGLPGQQGSGQAANKSSRTEEVTNFEISKTVESVVRAAGDVKRLSIAVVVDGRYEPDPKAVKPEGAPADWTAPKTYVPRSDEELDKIATLVKSAVGFDAGRGDTVEVVNMPFAETDFFEGPIKDDSILGFPRAELLGLAETLALSLVAVLAILAVFRPLISHFAAAAKTAASQSGGADDMPPLLAAQGMQPQLAGPQGMLPGAAGAGMMGAAGGELDSMIDMTSVEGKVKASSVQKISELVTNHPNETVSVIRQWMSQEN